MAEAHRVADLLPASPPKSLPQYRRAEPALITLFIVQALHSRCTAQAGAPLSAASSWPPWAAPQQLSGRACPLPQGWLAGGKTPEALHYSRLQEHTFSRPCPAFGSQAAQSKTLPAAVPAPGGVVPGPGGVHTAMHPDIDSMPVRQQGCSHLGGAAETGTPSRGRDHAGRHSCGTHLPRA